MIFVLTSILVVMGMLAGCAAPTPEPAAALTQEPMESIPAEAATTAPDSSMETKMDLRGWKVASLMPGPINDAGFSAARYDGLLVLKDEYRAEVAYTDRVQAVEAEAVLKEYAKNGYQVVMAHGYEFDDSLTAVAPEYPDVMFVQVDGAVANDKNLYSFGYHTGEGGYLLGYIAANLTKSKKIGLIGGTTDPAMVWEFKEAQAAIKSVLPDAKIMEVYVGSWDDPAKAKELAQSQLEAGADQLITVTDAGDIGVIEAAHQAYDAGNKDIRVLSWGQDKWELAPNILIPGWSTSNKALMIKAMETIINKEPAGHYVYGLQDGVVFLHPFHGFWIASVCHIKPQNLYVLVAPSNSLVCAIQISARPIDNIMHRLHAEGFDIHKVPYAVCKTPVAPLIADELSAMGRINDCMLYGGQVLVYLEGEDREIERMLPNLPAKASTEYGKTFEKIFVEHDCNFHKIDLRIFSVALIQINNITSGRCYSVGSIDKAMLRKSFFEK